MHRGPPESGRYPYSSFRSSSSALQEVPGVADAWTQPVDPRALTTPVANAQPSSARRVLVVDDDAISREIVSACLEKAGYRVLQAGSGAKGIELALEQKPAAVILDWMMADMDGMQVLAEVRRLGTTMPILMLTARGGVKDRVHGLATGHDEFLPKTCNKDELFARLGALLRRDARTSGRVRQLHLGPVLVDLDSRSASANGGLVPLSRTEFAILELLADRIGSSVSRELMLDVVWGYTRFPSTRTVDTHIWRLRRKLGDGGENPRWIKRVHGSGYLLASEAARVPTCA